MNSGASENDTLYARTPSQAEGERDEPDDLKGMEQHPDTPRTEPSQAEGERVDEIPASGRPARH